jgi:hypothetical protein
MEELIKKDGKLWSSRPGELKPVEFTYLDEARKMAYIANIERLLPEDRSSFDELPVEFPELLFSHGEKIEWLKQVF